MARTKRRGKPSRSLKRYLHLGEIWGENSCSGLGYPLWKDNGEAPKTYAQYVAGEIRHYHQDKRSRGLPRYVRKLDVNRQRREHEHLIHRAVRSGDFDVALTTLAQQASRAYW